MTKKIILFIFMFMLFFASRAFASVVTLVPSKNSIGIGEQFYVDVMLDPQNVSVNGIEGSVSFREDNISFVRAENGKSLVSFWIEEPKLNGNVISFAGIIPNGFDGVIDPFNPTQRLLGLMVRLIFESKSDGVAFFSAVPFSLTQNDGKGTILNTEGASASVNIQNISNIFEYKNSKDVSPKLEAYVVKDPNLFNNKYALVFQAKDVETGIKDVMIKEGNRDWKKINSPYLLEDQTRRSQIALEAVNFSGVSIITVIDPIPFKLFSPSNVVLLIIFIIIVFFFIKKIITLRKNAKQNK